MAQQRLHQNRYNKLREVDGDGPSEVMKQKDQTLLPPGSFDCWLHLKQNQAALKVSYKTEIEFVKLYLH